MTKQNQLVRTCIACGNEKPLAAFLQITGSQGTTYGNVCSTCRGATAKTKTTITLNEDDRGSGSSGVRIGNTARNKAEMLQEKEKKEKKQDRKDYLNKIDERDLDKKLKKDLKTDKERDHRAFIEGKKQGFLRFQDKKVQQILISKKFHDAKATLQQHQETVESEKLSENIKQEARITGTDLTVPFLDPQFTLIKFHSPIFLEFKRWLGSSAPIMRTFEQLFKKQTEMKVESKHDSKHFFEMKRPREDAKSDPLIDYSHTAWGPSSRKR